VSVLDEILREKRREVAAARRERPLAALERACAGAPPPRGLAAALRRPAGQPVRFLAEIKRASPSAGPIRPGADPAAIAREYAAAGAAAISVLTDQRFFDGHLDFVAAVRGAVDLPILRKEFVVDPYQVVEARAAGADGVLLIAAALDRPALAEALAAATALGLDALVEVHDRREAERAVAVGAGLIGVNHRDLARLTIDLGLSARLRPLLPADAVVVGESGVRSAADVAALAAAGVDALLVGEQLMRAPSPGAALRALREGA
jgi:indole-3-glycerol phosphate synthase